MMEKIRAMRPSIRPRPTSRLPDHHALSRVGQARARHRQGAERPQSKAALNTIKDFDTGASSVRRSPSPATRSRWAGSTATTPPRSRWWPTATGSSSESDRHDRRHPRDLQHRSGLQPHRPGAARPVAAVPRGEVVALLGSNGAGKSTTLKAVSNLLGLEDGAVTAGRITFERRSDRRSAAACPGAAGLFHVMEGRRIFEDLTVEENLVAATSRAPAQGRRQAALRSRLRVLPPPLRAPGGTCRLSLRRRAADARHRRR